MVSKKQLFSCKNFTNLLDLMHISASYLISFETTVYSTLAATDLYILEIGSWPDRELPLIILLRHCPYAEEEDQSFWTFRTSDLFFLLISGMLVYWQK